MRCGGASFVESFVALEGKGFGPGERNLVWSNSSVTRKDFPQGVRSQNNKGVGTLGDWVFADTDVEMAMRRVTSLMRIESPSVGM